jgi:hypothetical protein
MVDREIEAYYGLGAEEKRLDASGISLERVRTQTILRRELPRRARLIVQHSG